MVEHILGNYLIDTGKITKEQFDNVMELQDTTRVKLGVLAVSEGLMTTEQADEVNLLQIAEDRRFGDIAIEEGYLTAEQVEKLLKNQGSAYLAFIQNLMDEDYVTSEELDWLLDDFKKVNHYSNSDFENIKSDDVEKILPYLLPQEAMTYCPLVATVVRAMIRLVDRHVYLGRAAMDRSLPTADLALQRMTGVNGIVDCLAERNGALLKTCCIYGQEMFSKLDEVALDAAGELLNCANGMYVSELSNQGRFLDLMPPEYASIEGVSDICRIPVFIGNVGLYLMVGKLK
ncbi:MAG: hypothetical protein NC079_04925 [Clostridium sp.]|nr:hypothetical protein [Acetatifactor muris]MCM1526864.1 hypothetical protein [Bacteroides sp.]MCM1562936.1 hypothetical protein [Clostridium sp.]